MGVEKNKRYQIWIGNYHLGQGSDPPTRPELVAVIWSCSFKLACYELELQSHMEIVYRAKLAGKEDMHTYVNQYNPDTLTNSWTGKYYETEREAWYSFRGYTEH